MAAFWDVNCEIYFISPPTAALFQVGSCGVVQIMRWFTPVSGLVHPSNWTKLPHWIGVIPSQPTWLNHIVLLIIDIPSLQPISRCIFNIYIFMCLLYLILCVLIYYLCIIYNIIYNLYIHSSITMSWLNHRYIPIFPLLAPMVSWLHCHVCWIRKDLDKLWWPHWDRFPLYRLYLCPLSSYKVMPPRLCVCWFITHNPH